MQRSSQKMTHLQLMKEDQLQKTNAMGQHHPRRLGDVLSIGIFDRPPPALGARQIGAAATRRAALSFELNTYSSPTLIH